MAIRRRIDFAYLAECVRQNTDIIEIARWLGMEIRGSRAPCPFHSEHSAGAFQFNTKEGYCHCHSCGESADAIKLTSHCKGIKPYEALILINDVFGLNLNVGDHKPSQSQRRSQSEYEKRRAGEQLLRTYNKRLKEILRELYEWKRNYAPAAAVDEWDERYVFSVSHIDIAELLYDIVLSGNLTEYIGKSISLWTREMQEIDPKLQARKEIETEINSNFERCIEGKISLDTLIKKHRKAVKDFANTK